MKDKDSSVAPSESTQTISVSEIQTEDVKSPKQQTPAIISTKAMKKPVSAKHTDKNVESAKSLDTSKNPDEPKEKTFNSTVH